jgi:ATP-dependent Clp protease ATP-binding subunit ClpA
VTFGSLTPDVMETIVEKFVLELESQLRERRVAITLLPAARAYLAKKGYDPVYGARPLKRVIQKQLIDRLALKLLEGEFRDGDTVRVDADGGELTFEKTMADKPEKAAA